MDPLTIYQRLAQYLTKDNLPSSIEIVPGSELQWSSSVDVNPHFPFLLIDGNLGIPQSILYKAYMYSVKQLPRIPKPNRTQSIHSGHDNGELVSSTGIVLLANPAHNTALNRRKQLMDLESPLLTPHHELKYIAALLGMKQASKSSILWHHRRWILRRIYDRTTLQSIRSSPNGADSDTLFNVQIPCDILTAEFEVAARASEIYPRNYHAWLHRYICVQCLISQLSEGSLEAADALHLEMNNSQRWVELHASDYTAIQYMARLVSALQDLGPDAPFPVLSPAIEGSPLASLIPDFHPMIPHALSLVSSYPSHESLWSYLRLAFAVTNGQSTTLYRWLIDFTLCFPNKLLSDNNKHPLDMLDGPMLAAQNILTTTRAEDVTRIQNYALHLFIWTLVSNGNIRLDEALIQFLRVGSEPPGLEYLRGLRAT